MSAWSNIEIHPDDPEIIQIDQFEKNLKQIPPDAKQTRDLITRFEVCHFKYKQHIRYIRDAILFNKHIVNPEKIGEHHIRQGMDALKTDRTGRSQVGQKYILALFEWLGESQHSKAAGNDSVQPDQRIPGWLGEKEPEKERLVRLLIARLKWDWKSYEELIGGEDNKKLEYQVCRMDVCHYNFPENLDSLIRGIGKLKPVEKFEGCGSFNAEIKSFAEREFSILIENLNSITAMKKPARSELIKAWLIACFAKTLKEQIDLITPVNISFK